MANQDQHDGDNGTPQLPPAAPSSDAAKPAFAGAARRRFATKSAAVVGAVLTVKSQPGMATGVCHSPSGYASGNVNSHNPHIIKCGGRKPDHYCQKPYNWHSNCKSTAKFETRFNCNTTSGFKGKTMDTLSAKQPFDPDQVAMHCIAAYQNALFGYTTAISTTKVQEIWNEYWRTGGSGRGYYMPKANEKWYGAQIVTYLKSTMTG